MSIDAAALPIEFDDVIYALQAHGGITQYWQQITHGIARRPGFSVSRCTAPAWHRLLRIRSAARVFHSSYFRIASGRGVRNVVSVHDMAFELGYAGNDLRARLARLERRRAYFAADALVCVSESTRRDLLALFPALERRCPVAVIHHGPTLDADAPLQPLTALLPDPPVPFVLFVGGRKHYKNFGGALRAFAGCSVARNGGLLICTGTPFTPLEREAIAARRLTGRVVEAGMVSRDMLASLYRHAECLLYPSRFEGFGMPVLEAMTLGCPVVAAAASSIPEIAGDAAVLVDPADPEAMIAALDSLADPSRRSRLIAAGKQRARAFSWTRSIDAHASVYHALA